MPFLGATIIAAILFFVLNLLSSLYLDADGTALAAFFEALIKTAVFSVLFHYLHNWTAQLFNWYRIDEPDKKHTFDRTPALDQVRDGGVR